MNYFNHVYFYFVNLGYLIKSHYKRKEKAELFFTYTIYLLLLPIMKIMKHRSIRIFGLKIIGFDFETLFYLFAEIFIRDDYYFKSTKDNPLILDCGANIGMASIYFKHVYPNSTITVFEPDPKTFELLSQNIENNKFKKVTLKNEALSENNGKINFYKHSNQDGILTMSTLVNRIDSSEKIEVKAKKLSNYIDNTIDFLKIDVEGKESDIFADLLKTEKISYIESMVIEFHHNVPNDSQSISSFISVLEQSGYNIQLGATQIPLYKKDFQDILISAIK